MVINENLKRASIIGIIIIFSLAGLFFISKTNALTSSSLDIRPPDTTSQTQTEIWAGNPQQVRGALNNAASPNTNQCGSLGQYNVVRSIGQNSNGSFDNISYWQFDSWGSALIGTTIHTATDWLKTPPSYDLNCWTTEPQVRWREAPAT